MAILIENSQRKHPIQIKKVEQQARVILNALDFRDGELSIVLTDDDHIAQLNRSYLNHQGPTNVISFPLQEGPFADYAHKMLGDVVISMDTACREASEAGIALEERVLQLLIHGILHLAGYDHVASAEEAEVMERKARELLQLLR